MALSIKDEETDALVRKLAMRRNLSMTQAIKLAVSNELSREDATQSERQMRILREIAELQAQMKLLPDRMTAQEIDAWMYDENGLPH
jgi:antitoxin VapB